jgi:hypothetical protein
MFWKEKSKILPNLRKMSRVPWRILTTLHIFTSKYYQHAQNRHDTVEQKKMFARSWRTTKLNAFMQPANARKYEIV